MNPAITINTYHNRRLWHLYLLLSVSSLLFFPLALGDDWMEAVSACLAMVLISICLYPTIRYIAKREHSIPLFPILTLAYAAQFGLPVLIREQSIQLVGDDKIIEPGSTVVVLTFAILGAIALQFGFYLSQQKFIARSVPVFNLNLNERRALFFCLIAGGLLPLAPQVGQALLQENFVQFSALILLLQRQALVAISILGWLVYSRQKGLPYKIFLYALVAVSVVRGASGTMLEEAVIPIMVLSITIWHYTRRIPWKFAALIIFIIIFLSPVKSRVRERLWFGAEGEDAQAMSTGEKTQAWAVEAVDYWIEVAMGSRSLSESLEPTTNRLDFISTFGHVYEMTPESIPYAEGKTLYAFTYAFIPRAVWPDKPTFGTASK